MINPKLTYGLISRLCCLISGAMKQGRELNSAMKFWSNMAAKFSKLTPTTVAQQSLIFPV